MAGERRSASPAVRHARRAPLPHGAPRITEDDYYARAREFRHWLAQSREKYLDEIPSAEARRYFAKFVRRWNDARLDDPYYAGEIRLATTSARPTRFRWSFRGEPELERVRDSVVRWAAVYGADRQDSMTNRAGADAPPPSAPAPAHPAERQYQRELDAEARRAEQRAARRQARREDREWAEEHAPRATGREAMLERRRERAAEHRAFAERRQPDDDVADGLSEEALMGTREQDSFQAAYVPQPPRSPTDCSLAARDRAEQRRQERRSERQLDAATEKQARIEALRSKEDATMAMFRQVWRRATGGRANHRWPATATSSRQRRDAAPPTGRRTSPVRRAAGPQTRPRCTA